MKVLYRFYIKPKDRVLDDIYYDDNLSIKDKYPLYAYTTKKKYRDEFVSIRNMDRFIEFSTEVTKEEFVAFSNSNSGAALRHYKLEHHEYAKNKKHLKEEEITVLCTWHEREIVDAYVDTGFNEMEAANPFDFFPLLFNKKYTKALNTLEFINCWKMTGYVSAYDDIMKPDELESIDYSAPDIKFDELNIFIELFKDTLDSNSDE